jgi:hypothetical protein
VEDLTLPWYELSGGIFKGCLHRRGFVPSYDHDVDRGCEIFESRSSHGTGTVEIQAR